MPLRIIFMGTPEFSVPVLTGLIGQDHEIVTVYTQPPRPAGRGMAERKSAIHEKAEQFGLPVLTPASLKSEPVQQQFAAFEADLAVVVAYGLLLPQAILDAPRLGAYNVHASLLPRWRGAAPIQRAIMAGDTETGVTIMKMEAGLDTGPIAMAQKIPIGPDMTAGELHDELSVLGSDLMARAAGALERDLLTLTPQPEEGVTYAEKIGKDETRVGWNKPADRVHNHIRGLSPFPGAWCEMEFGGGNERVKLLHSTLADGAGAPGEVLDGTLAVACGEGAVRLLRLQRAGKQPANAEAFLAGNRIEKGVVLP